MEKYNKLLRNITELFEKGLLNSKDLKKDIEDSLKFKIEVITNQLNLVSREEFEIQKKTIKKLQKNISELKKNKKKNYKGKEILTRKPPKVDFIKEILPPCDLIISFAIDKPNPTPDLF